MDEWLYRRSLGLMKMIPIKFRVWMQDKNKMSDPFTLVDIEVESDNFPGFCSFMGKYDYPIMQFTGLLDKNGKEIYEGDIVQYECLGAGKDGVALIHNLSPTQGFFVNVPDDPTDGDVYIEVIGNIHENPELLKSIERG